MAVFRFEQIAINSTEKKKPTEADRMTYLGLEHLDSGCLRVSRFGSEVAPIGEKLVMRKGDVLFGKRRAYQKKVAIAPFDGIFSAHGMVLRPNEAVIDKDFFPLFISSNYFLDAAIAISVGSLSPTINWRDLKELEFNLPPLEEQKRLAEVLWAAENTLEKYKNLVKSTDELVKSQFIEMFGGYSLRNKQSDWVKISSVAEIVGGSTPKTENAEYWGGKHNWITPAEISDDSFIVYKTQRTLTGAGVKSCSLRLLPIGTVLLSSRAPIGKVAITGVEMYCNQGFKNLICGQSLNSIYIYYLLKFNSEYLNSLGRGATFKEISKSIVDNIAIPVPEIELQNRFAAFVEQTDKSKFELEQSLAELTATYKRIISENLG